MVLSRYAQAYFGKAGRVQPLIHTMLIVGVIGYAIEYPHLKHEQEAARHKEAAHH